MQISDLIPIGQVQTRKSSDGQQKVMLLKLQKEFQHLLTKIDDVFLLFTDHRVRYTKIIFTQNGQTRSKDIEVSFDDEDVIEEILGSGQRSADSEKRTANSGRVQVCLDGDALSQIEDDDMYFDPVGMSVICDDEVVATIKGFFFNGAHDVYEILLADGREILFPDVDEWVTETNIPERYIKVRDLDQFINL